MRDLVNTPERYLRTLWDLIEDGIPTRQSRLAARVNHTTATVCQTVARMNEAGLVDFAEDRTVLLTAAGFARARAITRKHRITECFLTRVLGMSAEHAHEEACRWQHVMSAAVERRIVELLGVPRVSPWGNPIPGLEELGFDPMPVPPVTRVADLPLRRSVPAIVCRVSEQAQSDPELLGMLTAAGVVPGASVTLSRTRRYVRVRAQESIELPLKYAHLFAVAEVACAVGSDPVALVS